jgi:hypothetical protein
MNKSSRYLNAERKLRNSVWAVDPWYIRLLRKAGVIW